MRVWPPGAGRRRRTRGRLRQRRGWARGLRPRPASHRETLGGSVCSMRGRRKRTQYEGQVVVLEDGVATVRRCLGPSPRSGNRGRLRRCRGRRGRRRPRLRRKIWGCEFESRAEVSRVLQNLVAREPNLAEPGPSPVDVRPSSPDLGPMCYNTFVFCCCFPSKCYDTSQVQPSSARCGPSHFWADDDRIWTSIGTNKPKLGRR